MLQQRVVGFDAGQLAQQRHRDQVAEDGNGTKQLRLGRRQARNARLDQHLQPCSNGLRAVAAQQVVPGRVTQLFDVQRISARIAVNLFGNEGVGLR